MPENEHDIGDVSKTDQKIDTKQQKKKASANRCLWCNALIEHGRWCDDDCKDDWELSTFS